MSKSVFTDSKGKLLRHAAEFYRKTVADLGDDSKLSIHTRIQNRIAVREETIEKFDLIPTEFCIVMWASWGLKEGIKNIWNATQYGMDLSETFREYRYGGMKGE